MSDERFEQIFERPLSSEPVLNLPPALVPPRTDLIGEDVTLEPQNAEKHAQELFDASHGNDEALKIWDYLTYGPWPSVDAYAVTVRSQSASFDPIFYAIR